jgi:hypothetical protein
MHAMTWGERDEILNALAETKDRLASALYRNRHSPSPEEKAPLRELLAQNPQGD